MRWHKYPNTIPSNSRPVLISLKWSDDDYSISISEYLRDGEETGMDYGFGKLSGFITGWAELPKPYKRKRR